MRLKVVEGFWIVYTLLLSACSTPGLADEIKDHCLPGEEVYFSCLMKNEKTLSLCGSKKCFHIDMDMRTTLSWFFLMLHHRA